MFYVTDKETGTIIENVATIEEGKQLIHKFEESDKVEGIYEPDFYDVVDDDLCSVI